MRERQQMASRPFASVDVALEAAGGEQTDPLRVPLEGAPKPIAVEPCSGNKAAVLTVFVCLPRGSSEAPPPGQSGKISASPTTSTIELLNVWRDVHLPAVKLLLNTALI
ncbi:Attractin-like protein 1 [Acipenser ruthenus]|uniref:Attractin-like protein 1 n=1 Tax=Acipenser ruthenus TaxID=7906 RepID=A0A444TXW2_ACIRT|nr:Attractin-like protein 1 [Acipenser ruthenus]